MTDNYTYDAIVVGSGISGGWAAKELTERGLKVLMLERGRPLEHIKDYETAGKDPWEFSLRGKVPLEKTIQFPVANRSGALNDRIAHYLTNEQQCPYTETKPFNWIRSYQVGGRSILWGRQSYRLSDFDFEANLKDGIATDWPIRYKDLAKWYDHVETFAGISGSMEGLPHLPDGKFLPAMEMNCVEKDVKERLKKQFNDTRHMIIGRTAHITAPHAGRTQCQYRDRCWEGCPFGAYFSTQSSTLPAAMKTGNLTVRPFSIVHQLLYDKDKKKATGVEVLDAQTNMTYHYKSKIVFVCASTFNSTWLLMNSATDIWPDGLGSSSGELGHNVMDHHANVGAFGRVEGFEDKYYTGRRANGFYIVRYANLFGDQRSYQRGFGFQGSASREGWSRQIAEANVKEGVAGKADDSKIEYHAIGKQLKETLAHPGEWQIGMYGFGEVLPYHDNKISLNKNVRDKWGLPVLNFDCELKGNELRMRDDMENESASLLEAVGVKDIKKFNNNFVLGNGVHEMGTARMGNDPRTSVLNKWNQVWDAPNVFVTDGAAMTSSACQNPSLTYMAMTARAVDYAVRRLKIGEV